MRPIRVAYIFTGSNAGDEQTGDQQDLCSEGHLSADTVPATAHQGSVAFTARAGEGGVKAVARAVLRARAAGAQVAVIPFRALLPHVRPAHEQHSRAFDGKHCCH